MADDVLPELPYQVNDYSISFHVHLLELKTVTADASQSAVQDAVKLEQYFKNAQRCIVLIEKDFNAIVKAFKQELRRVKRATHYTESSPGSSPQATPTHAPQPPPLIPPPIKVQSESAPVIHPTSKQHPNEALLTTKPVTRSVSDRNVASKKPATATLGGGSLAVTSPPPPRSKSSSVSSPATSAADTKNSPRDAAEVEMWAHLGNLDVSLLHSEKKEKIKFLVRRGIPAAYRAKAWAAFSSADALLADRPKLYEHAIRNTFPWVMDMSGTTLSERMKGFTPRMVPLFGGQQPFMHIQLDDEGVRWTKIVLCLLAQNTCVTYCPALPVFVAVLMLYLPPEKVYAAGKFVLNASEGAQTHRPAVVGDGPNSGFAQYRYIPTTRIQSQLMVELFQVLYRVKIPTVARRLDKLGANLRPIVEQWFNSLFLFHLPLDLGMNVLDTFLVEGSKILQRAGLAILKTFEKELLRAESAAEVEQILDKKPSTIDDAEEFMRRAFSIQLQRKEMDAFEQNLRDSLVDSPSAPHFRDGVYFRPSVATPSAIVEKQQWEILFHWMPNISATSLRLAFSATRDGFSLRTLFHKCESIGPNLLLVKAAPHSDEAADGALMADIVTDLEVFGAYNSHPLKVTKKYYGNGTCFVFRLHPIEDHFTWVHLEDEDTASPPTGGDPPDDTTEDATTATATTTTAGPHDSDDDMCPPSSTRHLSKNLNKGDHDEDKDGDEEDDTLKDLDNNEMTEQDRHQQAILRKNMMFINGFRHMLEFGGGGEGPALVLTADLQKGRTFASETYNNPPLCSEQLFDIIAVEVYTFV